MEKIQKVLANLGLASRRTIEQWISDGRICVNGQVAKLGDRITLGTQLTLDGKPIKLKTKEPTKQRAIIYYKPEGELCSRKEDDTHHTVFKKLPALTNSRWIMVGRLDLNSMGLLLFTTDGELAHRLMHPSYEIEREYAVRILGRLNATHQQRLLKGIPLEDGLAKFNSLKDAGGEGANHWYHVTLSEGRNREVRRMFETFGIKVSRLIRIRYGEVKLPPRLRAGQYIELSSPEIKALLRSVELSS